MQKQPHEYDPEYNRNLIIAFALISILMGLWYYFYELPHKRQLLEERNRAEIQRMLQEKQQPVKDAPLLENQDLKQVIETSTPKTRDEILPASPRIKIANSKLHGSIDLKGARLDDLTFAEYKETLAKNSPEVVLLSPPGTVESNFIEAGWISPDTNIKVPDSQTMWKAEGNGILTDKTPVTLSWDNGQGFIFHNKFSLDNNYMFTLEQSIENKSAAKATFFPYALISRNEAKLDKAPAGDVHTGPMGVMDGTLTEISYKSLREDKKKEYANSTGWIGITDKYWAKALIPQAGENYKANFRYSIDGDKEKFQVDYLGQARTVEPNQTATYSPKILAGAKELKILETYRDEYHIPMFDKLIDFRPIWLLRIFDFGWFYLLAKTMMQGLLYFYKLTGNFGVAIIMLTFCVKLILFPLARRTYISMGRMRDLQPKLKALGEQYKDKMVLNQKKMELFKKEGVHPASGCLPLLIQMPIFFALYKVFYVSIEMRHAPFFGWIHDLSAQDPTSFFNLFGLLPFHAPSYLMIGAWPILWAITMYIQQLIQPPITDPTQAKMMRLMPLFLLVVFAPLPAGLVIYYTFNNLLTICQQLYFLKFHSKK